MEAAINGLTTAYDDTGEKNLPPLVFIHGFPLSRRSWRGQVAAVKGRVRAIAYDIRGLGESGVGDGQYSLEFFVDDLLGLLDRLGLQKAGLCGLSMGGYIALRAVERAPERVSSLVLCDTKSEADGDEGRVKRAAAVRAVKKDGVAAFASGFAKSALSPEGAARPEVVESVAALVRGNSPLGICGCLLAMAARTDTTAALPRIAVPTLVLVGEKDSVTPPAAAEALARAIPKAKLAVIPGAGHLSNLENPEEFNRRLLSFL